MKPKILHVVGDSKFGGATLLIRDISLAAQSDGYAVDVLTTDPDSISFFSDNRIGVVASDFVRRQVRPRFDILAMERLTSFLEKSDYHVVHTHTTKGGLVGRWAAWRAHVPVVVHTSHGFAFHEATSPSTLKVIAGVERRAARWCHRVVTVSEFHRQWAIELGIAGPGRIIAIPNGISVDRVSTAFSRDEARKSLSVDGDVTVVAACGRLSKQKGIEYLLSAAETVRSSGARVIFLIAGDGPLRHALQDQAELGRAADTIRFLGFRDDIGTILKAADIVALPSLWEGLSISLLEAMAAGKPVITTSIGSNREVTGDGAFASLVEPGDSAGLARAILHLAETPEAARVLGELASIRFRTAYTQQRMLDSYISLYRNPRAFLA